MNGPRRRSFRHRGVLVTAESLEGFARWGELEAELKAAIDMFRDDPERYRERCGEATRELWAALEAGR